MDGGNSKKNAICAGCVVFRMNESGGIDFLLIKHEKDKNNRYGFPKGHLEESESIEECAVRETWEETGVVTRLLYELPPVFTSNKNENKIVHMFLAKQLNPQNGISNENGEGEISEVRWFDIDQLPEIYYYQKPLAIYAKNIIMRNMK